MRAVAIRCPDCDWVPGAFFDDFPCSGCENAIEVVRDFESAEIDSVIVTQFED